MPLASLFGNIWGWITGVPSEQEESTTPPDPSESETGKQIFGIPIWIALVIAAVLIFFVFGRKK